MRMPLVSVYISSLVCILLRLHAKQGTVKSPAAVSHWIHSAQ